MRETSDTIATATATVGIGIIEIEIDPGIVETAATPETIAAEREMEVDRTTAVEDQTTALLHLAGTGIENPNDL